MKQIFTYTALLFTLSAFAQEPKLNRNSLGQVEYSEVVTLDSFPSSQLHFNAKLFLTSAFHGAREVAQIKDDKTKTVATKGSFPVTIESSDGQAIQAKTYFTFIIQSKENMYRYTLNDFYFAFTEETGITSYASFNDHLGVGMTKKQWQQVEEQTEDFTKAFIENLKEEMLQKEVLCREITLLTKKKKAR